MTEYQIIYYVIDAMQIAFMLGAIIGCIMYAFRPLRRHANPDNGKVEKTY